MFGLGLFLGLLVGAAAVYLGAKLLAARGPRG